MPERSTDAAYATFPFDGTGALGNSGSARTGPPSPQAASAGTINVAICPGAVLAAMMASMTSLGISELEQDVLTHFEKGRAIASMSDVSGAL